MGGIEGLCFFVYAIRFITELPCCATSASINFKVSIIGNYNPQANVLRKAYASVIKFVTRHLVPERGAWQKTSMRP